MITFKVLYAENSTTRYKKYNNFDRHCHIQLRSTCTAKLDIEICFLKRTVCLSTTWVEPGSYSDPIRIESQNMIVCMVELL